MIPRARCRRPVGCTMNDEHGVPMRAIAHIYVSVSLSYSISVMDYHALAFVSYSRSIRTL